MIKRYSVRIGCYGNYECETLEEAIAVSEGAASSSYVYDREQHKRVAEHPSKKRYSVSEVGFHVGDYETLGEAQKAARGCHESAQIFDREKGEVVDSSINHGVSG